MTDTAYLKKQAVKFKRSSDNLIWVIIFSFINLILTYLEADLYFPFSITASESFSVLGKEITKQSNNITYAIVGAVIAIIIISIYLIFWLLTKRRRYFILGTFILYIIDSIFLLIIFMGVEFQANFLVNIAFHGSILYYLIIGVNAWSKLRGLNEEEYNSLLLNAPANIARTPVTEQGQQFNDMQNYNLSQQQGEREL